MVNRWLHSWRHQETWANMPLLVKPSLLQSLVRNLPPLLPWQPDLLNLDLWACQDCPCHTLQPHFALLWLTLECHLLGNLPQLQVREFSLFPLCCNARLYELLRREKETGKTVPHERKIEQKEGLFFPTAIAVETLMSIAWWGWDVAYTKRSLLSHCYCSGNPDVDSMLGLGCGSDKKVSAFPLLLQWKP